MTRDKTWQAKTLADAHVLDAIAALQTVHGTIEREHVVDHFAGIPRKVVLAKLDAMRRAGTIDWCGCGLCDGDLTVLPPMWTVGQLVERADNVNGVAYRVVEPPDADGLFLGATAAGQEAILDSTLAWRKAIR